MTEPSDVVLAYWAEHRQQLRQSETQRATLTNFLLVFVVAVSGFIIQQDLKIATMALSALIVAVGLYGALTMAKYHERADYHLTQARALTQVLIDLGALGDHKAALEGARQVHRLKYPRIQKLRLHMLWTGLHLAIAFYGVILILATLIKAAA